jgi:hypothetical protein
LACVPVASRTGPQSHDLTWSRDNVRHFAKTAATAAATNVKTAAATAANEQ